MIPQNEVVNFETLRDSLQGVLVQRLLPASRNNSQSHKRAKGRKNEIKPVSQPVDLDKQIVELSDFIEYFAEETFEALPDDLRTLSFTSIQEDAILKEKYALPLGIDQQEEIIEALPPTVKDSLISYQMLSDESELGRFFEPILSSYITASTTPSTEYAPNDTARRPDGCEICERTQLPLTYHHLIPREMHERALKRNWHSDWELNKVAWLCRACHSFVHRIASNEELARTYHTVDLLLERADVQRWAVWASRIRWKAR